MGRGAATAAALAAALAVVACGDDPTAGEEEKVRATTEAVLESCARADGLATLDTLAQPARERFLAAPSVVEGCLEILAFGFAEPLSADEAKEAFGRADVTEVRTGESGFAQATVEAESGERTELELESSGDLWFLTTPLVPELEREAEETEPGAGATETRPQQQERTVRVDGLTANDRGRESVAGAESAELELDNFFFEPTVITGEPGQSITFEAFNESSIAHTFTITEQGIDEVLAGGEARDVDVVLPESGTVVFICRFHAQQGMRGALRAKSG